MARVHMNGRVYDPFLGRMISADPTVPGALNSQAFNRYSYVLNNPLNLTDPSGFTPQCGGSPRCQPVADGAGGNDFGMMMPNEWRGTNPYIAYVEDSVGGLGGGVSYEVDEAPWSGDAMSITGIRASDDSDEERQSASASNPGISGDLNSSAARGRLLGILFGPGVGIGPINGSIRAGVALSRSTNGTWEFGVIYTADALDFGALWSSTDEGHVGWEWGFVILGTDDTVTTFGQAPMQVLSVDAAWGGTGTIESANRSQSASGWTATARVMGGSFGASVDTVTRGSQTLVNFQVVGSAISSGYRSVVSGATSGMCWVGGGC